MSTLARLAAVLLISLAAAHAQDVGVSDAPTTAPGAAALFSDDDLLLFDVTSDGQELTDAFAAYSSRAGTYFPLGDLARLLDLAILVDPPEQRAEGWILSEKRKFVVDLKTHHASADGDELDLAPEDAILVRGEIFVRSETLQRLLPITLKMNKSELALEIVPRERFPFQDRADRERRRGSMGPGQGGETVMKVPAHYRLLSPPSFDLSTQANVSNHDPQRSANWEVRVGGDVAYTGLQLFAGSDANAKLSSVRALLERKDPDGHEAGVFGATRSDAGDVYTPALPIGVASSSGRGVFMTSRPLDEASVFSTTDIRGELPLGYEVELYVNEVLRGSQSVANRGNYEFLSVPLSYGLNVIRLVFYGPRGEHREEVRRINVGSGQIPKGQARFTFGLAEQGIPLISVRGGSASTGTFGTGSTRAVGALAYGVTGGLTLTGGVAQFTPNTSYDHRERQLGSLGLLTSLGGFGIAADAAEDDQGGRAETFGLGGLIGGVSLLARHAAYEGGFVDETQFRDLSSVSPLKRSSRLTADWAVGIPFTGLTVPMSAQAERSTFVDGSERRFQEARVSTVVGRYLVSGGWQNEVTDLASGMRTQTSSGTLDASTFVWQRWQLRASTAFDLEPKARINTAGFVVDGAIGANTSVRFGVQHAFAQGSGQGSTTFDTSATLHLPTHDISASLSYVPEQGEIRFGVQLALGTIYDPIRKHYVPVRPGAAAGGNAVIDAFVDTNGDGKHQAGEPAMAGLTATAGNWPAKSNKRGEIVATGLGDGARAKVRIDPELISDPYLTTRAEAIEIVPHPGQVAVVPYPLTPMGEVQLEMTLRTEDGDERGLSALAVQLVNSAGEVVAEGRTEYDGTLILERLPPGTYDVRIQPEQADRLSLGLDAPMTVTVPAAGGFAGQVNASVIVKR